jgi:hypothetical protein
LQPWAGAMKSLDENNIIYSIRYQESELNLSGR